MAVRVLLVLAAFAVLCSCGQVSSLVEKQEKQEGVEPESVGREQSRSLYQQAVSEKLPPYKIDNTLSDTSQRYFVYVVTEPTHDKPRLGRILVDLGEKSEAELVTAFFCARPGERCIGTTFGTGELAQTAQGRELMVGVGAGDVPFMRVQF